MLQRLRNRAQGQEGFTLIELLVVILIIGILAAVAIPTFLSQTQKAKDSNATAYLNSAQNAEASFQTSNGNYTSTPSDLTNIEPTLGSATGLAAVAATTAAPLTVPAAATPEGGASITNGFKVSDTTPTGGDGVTYTLYYDASNGDVIKTCSAAHTGLCNNNSQW